MPKAKYEPIYRSIREEIDSGKYSYGDFLPPESILTERFGCTRNTVRRALSILTAEGYVLPQHGRGVQVIYKPDGNRSLFTVGGIESFAEANSRNRKTSVTTIKVFKKMTVNEKTSLKTGFDVGAEVWYIERVRNVEGKAIIFDTNYFLCSEAPGLTLEIAASSIYNYLENDLHMNITTSRRRVTAEKARTKDIEYLDLGTFDFVLVVTGQVFNSKGVMFEFTQSRHRPDMVSFVESAVRQKIQE